MRETASVPTATSLRRRLLEPTRAGANDGCLIIGEVAQAHDGSLGTAHAYIDAIADAGADAVKFQTHIADAESTDDEPWRVRFSPQDERRIDYWRRMEWTPDQWRGLKEHAEERQLVFLSSPFSPEAVDLLENLGIAAWKVASGELFNPPLLRQMAATGKPMLLSTGMSTLDEIDAAIATVSGAAPEVDLAILQCTTAYPCPPERIGIEQLDVFRKRWPPRAVGLSDHSGTIFPSLAGVTLGADVVEIHVTLDRRSFGPDVAASVTADELAELVKGVRFIERMKASPVDKTTIPDSARTLRTTFGKRVVAARDLDAGITLEAADLALKKPGDGLPPSRFDDLIGGRLNRDVARNEPLHDADVEETGA